jgi:hypothetical protein
MYEVIICDPDEHKWEGQFMGLFYTALSRATTLGDDDGLNSAIYFTGIHFKESRFRNLGKKANSDADFENIVKRTKWVNHLKKHTIQIDKPDEKMYAILQWSESTRIDYDELHRRIKCYVIANIKRNPDSFCN